VGHVDRVVEQAKQEEQTVFTRLVCERVTGDPLVAMATGTGHHSIELGTAVLPNIVHPLLQANRAASVVAAMNRTRFALG